MQIVSEVACRDTVSNLSPDWMDGLLQSSMRLTILSESYDVCLALSMLEGLIYTFFSMPSPQTGVEMCGVEARKKKIT